MPGEAQDLIANTPSATAQVAQSHEGPGDTATIVDAAVEAAPCGEEGRDFVIGDGVTRAIYARPYERKASDPLYRPLRIFSTDPTASRLEGAEALVNVPYEPLEPGPVGAMFEVDDLDETTGKRADPVDLDDRAVLIRNGRAPSASDPLFHQQMVYAVCATVYAAFRGALGRHIAWGFTPRETAAGLRPQLLIHPHAREEANAYFDPHTRTLRFGYFSADKAPDGRTLPGGIVHSCLSHDIIAHEVTHALLDGLRANFRVPTGPDVLGFHEGFADLVALFQRFSYRELLLAQIRKSEGHLHAADVLTGLVQQFKRAQGFARPMRTMVDEDSTSPKLYVSDLESHEMGEVLARAIFEAALTVFRRKIAPAVRLATGGTGRLPPGEMPLDLQNIFASQASKIASHFLEICIRAIDYCPPVDIELGEYLRALVTADYDLVPDDPWGYREALIDAFARRRIYPPRVSGISEEALRWEGPELSVKEIPELNFSSLRFAGDPALPASAEHLREQACALGAILACPENLAFFGLAAAGDPSTEGDIVERPCIHSIRTSRRVGPDGQVIFDLVAEITQKRRARDPRGTFDFFGGATVILGPKGEIRYVIAKNILNRERLDRQAGYVFGAGKAFWSVAEGTAVPVANPFRLLHQDKSPKPKKTRKKKDA